jgi:Beta/Gamma crystallin
MHTMKAFAVILTALLFVAVGSVAAQPASRAGTPAAQQMTAAGEVPQIIAFDKDNFEGDHTHIFGDMPKLGKWDNSISSMIILSGTWEFFDDQNFQGTPMAKLGPGRYANVTQHGLKDNSTSSIRLVSPRERLSKAR